MKEAWTSEAESFEPIKRTAVRVQQPRKSKLTPDPDASRPKTNGHQQWSSRAISSACSWFPRRLLLNSAFKPALRIAVGIVGLLCLLWTLFLIVLSIAPNATVNYLMNTETFDHGTFWLLIDPPVSVYVMTAIALGPVVVSFSAVIFSLIRDCLRCRPRSEAKVKKARVSTSDKFASMVKKSVDDARHRSGVISSTARIVSNLGDTSSNSRKLANASMKIADMGVQIVLLVQLLERGLPLGLVSFFAAIVVADASFCAAVMLFSFENVSFTVAHAVIDTIFDFLISVGHPMIVVLYCMATFSFDRRVLAINAATFPPGAFPTSASVLANRVEVATILQSLYALQIYSPLRMFASLGSNMALSYRLHTLAAFANGQSSSKLTSIYPRRHPITLIFILIAIGVCIFVEESIRTSSKACSYHPECAVNAWRWTPQVDTGSNKMHLSRCPCLAVIDIDEAPKSYAEWTNPHNATEKLAQLATTGDLHTIEITNRLLPTFPDQLRGCTGLKHLTLIYTQTTSLPNWAKEFTKLEYLHMEGNAFGSFASLPDDLFDDMKHLTFAHIGVQPMLSVLPRLTGLVNLQSLTLAVLLSLQELPLLDSLNKLQMFLIIMCPTLDSLPDMTALTSLTAFITRDRGTYCCNGFRDLDSDNSTSTCDLSHSMCRVHPVWGTPAAECLPANRTDKLMTPGTREVFRRFPYTVCADQAFQPSEMDGHITPEYVEECDGTMFRKCSVGMCFNTRWMPISCEASPFPIAMRREQIRQGVGSPCDPVEEEWLGCSPSI